MKITNKINETIKKIEIENKSLTMSTENEKKQNESIIHDFDEVNNINPIFLLKIMIEIQEQKFPNELNDFKISLSNITNNILNSKFSLFSEILIESNIENIIKIVLFEKYKNKIRTIIKQRLSIISNSENIKKEDLEYNFELIKLEKIGNNDLNNEKSLLLNTLINRNSELNDFFYSEYDKKINTITKNLFEYIENKQYLAPFYVIENLYNEKKQLLTNHNQLINNKLNEIKNIYTIYKNHNIIGDNITDSIDFIKKKFENTKNKQYEIRNKLEESNQENFQKLKNIENNYEIIESLNSISESGNTFSIFLNNLQNDLLSSINIFFENILSTVNINKLVEIHILLNKENDIKEYIRKQGRYFKGYGDMDSEYINRLNKISPTWENDLEIDVYNLFNKFIKPELDSEISKLRDNQLNLILELLNNSVIFNEYFYYSRSKKIEEISNIISIKLKNKYENIKYDFSYIKKKKREKIFEYIIILMLTNIILSISMFVLSYVFDLNLILSIVIYFISFVLSIFAIKSDTFFFPIISGFSLFGVSFCFFKYHLNNGNLLSLTLAFVVGFIILAISIKIEEIVEKH